MKRKGFTLVELLAVIVVLAIIALIAVPSILGVIDKARIGALKDSAYGLVDAATLYYAQYGEAARFDFDDNGNVTSNTNNKLGYKGKVENGTVIINSKGQITVCLNDNNNTAYKNYLDTNLTVVDSKTCTVPSNTNIVYLDDEATITELDNATLTTKVTNIENQISLLNDSVNLTNEETIIGTYNGKNLYRRIVEYDTAIAASTIAIIDSELTTSYIDKIINMRGSFYSSYATAYYPLLYGSSTDSVRPVLASNGLKISNGMSYSISKIILVCEYTKTE